MKYEFVVLSDEYKNDNSLLYSDSITNDTIIDLSAIFLEYARLKYPIAFFVNGILMETKYYSYDDSTKYVTINKSYPVYSTDRIYFIFGSTDNSTSGFFSQIVVSGFSVKDETTITLKEPMILPLTNDIVCVIVNGVVYSTEMFEMGENNATISFSKYRPDEKDEVSVLILKKQ